MSTKGLGNSHRLAGAVAKRERIAWERIADGVQCPLRGCTYDAVGLVDRGVGFACAIHLDQAERLGYRVLRDPSEDAG